MNIKDVVEQAGLKYHNWITNESNIDDGDFKYPRLEDYKKFAALIAAHEREECANIAHQWSKREDDVGGYIEAAIRARSGA